MTNRQSNQSSQAAGRSNFTRRTFLRGVGACMALPALESVLSSPAVAAAATPTELAVTTTGAPLRMAFVYIPNGVIQDTWWPKGDKTNFEFGDTMKPLEALKNSVQVCGGLDHINATAGPDGAG